MPPVSYQNDHRMLLLNHYMRQDDKVEMALIANKYTFNVMKFKLWAKCFSETSDLLKRRLQDSKHKIIVCYLLD